MRLKTVPTPAATTPGRGMWEKYRGKEYLVFIDESAYQFFGFQNPQGNFCHATVGIPSLEYDGLKASMASMGKEYVQRVQLDLGEESTEFKYTEFARLPASFRRRFALTLRNALNERGGFIAGFYTPTKGFVMERVRENLIGQATEVPVNHEALYQAAVDEMRAERQGPGQANLITRLLWLPVASIVYFLGSYGSPFRLFYDPRERQEDEAVRAEISGLVDALVRSLETRFSGLYLGMENARTSEQELGLQLADLMAGEVRQFFLSHPEFLTFGCTLTLVTPQSREPLQEFKEIGGVLGKTGRVLHMPEGLRARLHRATRGSLLPHFRNLLAAGLLTCVADCGLERDLRIFAGTIFDLCD